MCKVDVCSLSLEELSEKLGNKIIDGANLQTEEIVHIKNGIGFVSRLPVSYRDNENVLGWIKIDKDKQLFKKVRFKNGSCKFKYRRFWRFTGDIEILYWYHDENAKCIKILACDCAK